jgi:ribosomal protein S18 acetylase RimI-like enzyme
MQRVNEHPVVVRPLTSVDAAEFAALRREALEREPFAFGASPHDDFARSIEQITAMLREPEGAVFGAFNPALVGMAGVRRLTRDKVRHKANLWGVYVRQEHRGTGVGRELLQAAIAWARNRDGVRCLSLTVTQTEGAAQHLYETLGFTTWGIEPCGLRVGETDLRQAHMFLTLRDRA